MSSATESSIRQDGIRSGHRSGLWLGVAIAIVIAMAGLIFLLHPLPPRSLTIACGPEGSSYAVFGKRYQAALAKQGIRVRLLATAGSSENIALLKDPRSGVDMGFVAGGVTPQDEDSSLQSLGTIAYEPIWFFTRGVANDRSLSQLAGKEISVGPEGSESRAITLALLKLKAINFGGARLVNLSPEASAYALIHGQIAAMVLVNSWSSPVVKELTKAPGITVVDFTRADAYVGLFPSLFQRKFPEGVANLALDQPHHDVRLLTTKTSVVVRGDLHPAMQYLLLETMTQLYAHPNIFQKAGEFPAPEALEFPVSDQARNYYKSGRPFLQRILPFWLAALVEQLLLLIIPLAGLAYPLTKGILSFYNWNVQRRIFSLYGELHWLESQPHHRPEGPASSEWQARLASLKERTLGLKVPATYVPMLYGLKQTLTFVEGQAEKKDR